MHHNSTQHVGRRKQGNQCNTQLWRNANRRWQSAYYNTETRICKGGEGSHREYTIHATEFEWTILRNGRVIVTDNIKRVP